MRTTMLPAAKCLLLRLVAALLAGNIAGGCRGELLHLDVLALEHLQQFDLAIGMRPRRCAIT